MDKEEYIDEINLILEQNNAEIELYPLVAEIIAPTLKGLSKRYVFARRRSELGQIYYGISAFPDIAILDRSFKNGENKDITYKNWEMLKGCVEAKAYDHELYSLDKLKECFNDGKSKPTVEVAELIGEVLWYKKVLYTNGKQWKLFLLDSVSDLYSKTIIELASKRIEFERKNNKSEEEFKWWENEEIQGLISKNIKEEVITKDCIKNWDEFIKKIEEIKWI